mmetsp:Transcript_25539/g.42626  ORF Transcript_25539/g.42626 Transcript_25539/m.42626 type:complete len:396 (+) Transcript_25539:133-1320(+)
MGAMIGSLVDSSPSKEFGEKAKEILSRQVVIDENGPREVITVAGGCFWSVELCFQRVPGVVDTEVGFTRGQTENPTYEQVAKGGTGHVEAVKVTFDSSTISLEQLLQFYWDIIDPTTLNEQGLDEGDQYRSGIYYHKPEQEAIILASRTAKQKTLKKSETIVTEIYPAAESTWYRAEVYHQKYLEQGGQGAQKGSCTPIRCYGLSYAPLRFDEVTREILQRKVEATVNGRREVITLAAGMFWGVELTFQRVPGVIHTEVGFTRGDTENPSYETVVAGKTNHVEAIKVEFDPDAIPFEDILKVFWDMIDPTSLDQQGQDSGMHFRTGIYYHTEAQKSIAEASRDQKQNDYSNPIVTEILAASDAIWYPADPFFQHYLQTEGQSAEKGDYTPIRQYG